MVGMALLCEKYSRKMKRDICLVDSKVEAAKAIFVSPGTLICSGVSSFALKSVALALPPSVVACKKLTNGPIDDRIIREYLLYIVL